MRAIVTIGFVLVLVCLAAAGYFMLRGNEKKSNQSNSKHDPFATESQRQIERNRRMAKVLGWRVGLSAVLFVVVLVSWQMDWLAPNTY